MKVELYPDVFTLLKCSVMSPWKAAIASTNISTGSGNGPGAPVRGIEGSRHLPTSELNVNELGGPIPQPW